MKGEVKRKQSNVIPIKKFKRIKVDGKEETEGKNISHFRICVFTVFTFGWICIKTETERVFENIYG